MSPKSPNPETEAMEKAKDSKHAPREENQGPNPHPGTDTVEQKRDKRTGQAPLPRDGL